MGRNIRVVLNGLTEQQRERIARRRARRKGLPRPRSESVGRLTASYDGDWAELLSDMTKVELMKSLTVLDVNELRVVVLRAFDGRQVRLHAQKQTPKGIIRRICHTAPEQLRKDTWKKVYAKILQDLGWKSDRVPQGLEDSVKLERIFDE